MNHFKLIVVLIKFHYTDVLLKYSKSHLLSYDAHEVEKSLDNTSEHCKSAERILCYINF